jgi:DNA invertase Pin-like site-specific DNA recombinase
MKKYKDEEWMRQEYIQKNRSMNAIAKELKCGCYTVARHLDKMKIKRRSIKDTNIHGMKKEATKERLIKEYIENGKSEQELAEMFNCTMKTMRKWLKENDIRIKTTAEQIKGKKTNRNTYKK